MIEDKRKVEPTITHEVMISEQKVTKEKEKKEIFPPESSVMELKRLGCEHINIPKGSTGSTGRITFVSITFVKGFLTVAGYGGSHLSTYFLARFNTPFAIFSVLPPPLYSV